MSYLASIAYEELETFIAAECIEADTLKKLPSGKFKNAWRNIANVK